MGKQTDYVFLRDGTWYLRIVLPDYAPDIVASFPPYHGRRQIFKSLKTSDKVEAQAKAAMDVAFHKMIMMWLRNVRKKTITNHEEREYPPGEHYDAETGERIFASETTLVFVDAKGTFLRQEENKIKYRYEFGDVEPGYERDMLTFLNKWFNKPQDATWAGPGVKTATPVKWSLDDKIIDNYVAHRNLKPRIEKECRDVWDVYKELVGKPLSVADRDDGRKLASFFFDQGRKSATVAKKVGWLCSAVNLAIDEKQLSFNPFSKVVAKRDDAMKRQPLSEDEMRLCLASIDSLSESDQVLWRLLAATGMRLSEAFSINEEFDEIGIRTIHIGKKSEQSDRFIPLPTCVLPFLPKKIDGYLFTGNADLLEAAASKRLNRFLNDVGIVDPRKVAHSLRHRAATRLRAVSCKLEHQHALLGHEEKTTADGYGHGYPMSELLPWIDRIGYGQE